MTRTATALALVLCIGVPAFQFGCQSKTERAEERTKSAAKSFHARLQEMPADIGTAMANLAAVTTGQNPNRESDFRRFQKSVEQMNEDARTVGAKYQQALANSNEFYREWNKEARRVNADERLKIEQQMNSRLATRADAMAYFDQARSKFLSFSATLSTIEKNLREDRGEPNVLAQGSLVQKAIIDAGDTRDYIERLDEVLSAASELK